MMRKRTIKDETTHNGSLETLVTFYAPSFGKGLHDRDTTGKEVFKARAEVYNPSMKDIQIMNGKGIKSALTIKFRHPLSSYFPKNNHFVVLESQDFAGQKWGIADIRPERDYITVLLNGDAYGK